VVREGRAAVLSGCEEASRTEAEPYIEVGPCIEAEPSLGGGLSAEATMPATAILTSNIVEAAPIMAELIVAALS
jgi:hypothetical protein